MTTKTTGYKNAPRARGPAASGVEPPRNVLLEVLPLMGDLHPGIVKTMRERYGTRFHLLLSGGVNSDFHRQHATPEDTTIDTARLWQEAETHAGQCSHDEIYATARRNEERYGITFMRDVVQMDRRLATQFNPSALASVHASHNDGSLVEIFGQINFYFQYFEKLFDRERIDLLIIRPDSRMGAPATYVAAKRGVPVTLAAAANYKSLATWMCGPFMAPDFIMARMDSAGRAGGRSKDGMEQDAERVPLQAKRFMSEQAGNLGKLPYLLRNLYRTTKIRIAHLLLDLRRGKRKRLAYTAVMGQHWKVYRAARYLSRIGVSDTQAISRRPFVLFLLQVEPEYSTLCLAREFCHTEAIVYQMALSMPAGISLVVKEHAPNIGNRPLDFYQRLRRLPNVIFADYLLPGDELAEASAAVATISGSIGKQSTRMGKPAIIFSTHVDYTQMPNVRVVTSPYDLPEALRWATKKRTKKEIADWRREGDRFYAALETVSFDGSALRVLGGDGGDLPQHEIERAVDVLVEVAGWQRRNGVPL